MTDETFHVHVPRTPPWAAGVPNTRDGLLAEAQLLAVEYFGAQRHHTRQALAAGEDCHVRRRPAFGHADANGVLRAQLQ